MTPWGQTYTPTRIRSTLDLPNLGGYVWHMMSDTDAQHREHMTAAEHADRGRLAALAAGDLDSARGYERARDWHLDQATARRGELRSLRCA